MNTNKPRAPRNRTICLDEAQTAAYAEKCVKVTDITAQNAENAVIHGDAFAAFESLPAAFADLAVIDPPYNLSKVYADTPFKKMDDSSYREFTLAWLAGVKRLLKPNGSIYVCCDWQSSLIIADALKQHFHVKNRITWQREKGRGAALRFVVLDGLARPAILADPAEELLAQAYAEVTPR